MIGKKVFFSLLVMMFASVCLANQTATYVSSSCYTDYLTSGYVSGKWHCTTSGGDYTNTLYQLAGEQDPFFGTIDNFMACAQFPTPPYEWILTALEEAAPCECRVHRSPNATIQISDACVYPYTPLWYVWKNFCTF